jgi:ribosomal protein S18 acetylase RimI-like enzyme
MEPGDIDEVARLDQQVFEPIWAISRVSLENAYTNAEHTSVAEIDGKIVGYELSTADHLSAHLTRLAVIPGYTHANIGYSLTREMFEFFTRRGIHHITVNTQDNNTASISLYKKLGFIMTSDTFPVFSLIVS